MERRRCCCLFIFFCTIHVCGGAKTTQDQMASWPLYPFTWYHTYISFGRFRVGVLLFQRPFFLRHMHYSPPTLHLFAFICLLYNCVFWGPQWERINFPGLVNNNSSQSVKYKIPEDMQPCVLRNPLGRRCAHRPFFFPSYVLKAHSPARPLRSFSRCINTGCPRKFTLDIGNPPPPHNLWNCQFFFLLLESRTYAATRQSLVS